MAALCINCDSNTEADLYHPPTTLHSLEDDLEGAVRLKRDSVLEGDNIERLHLALVDLYVRS